MANKEISSVLLIVDPLNDFCEEGALPVKGGKLVMRPLSLASRYILRESGLSIVVSENHPVRTSHFIEFGGIWPPHGVGGTWGAQYHPDLDIRGALRIYKGMEEDEDAYSAFHGRDKNGRTLHKILQERGARKIYVGGLATDYCVKQTVTDALSYGFPVTVISDGIAAVNILPGDGDKAIREMRAMGAGFVSSAQLVSGEH